MPLWPPVAGSDRSHVGFRAGARLRAPQICSLGRWPACSCDGQGLQEGPAAFSGGTGDTRACFRGSLHGGGRKGRTGGPIVWIALI